MSGVGLITGDTALGRHMATRLARALPPDREPLRVVIQVDKPATTPRPGVLHRLTQRALGRRSLSHRVGLYEREAHRAFLKGAGPAPDWPAGTEVWRVPVSRINDCATVESLRTLALSLIVLVGAPIVREPLLMTASRGVLNLHGSLLPHYRGSRVEIWQVLNDDLGRAGMTIHYVSPGVDTGDIVLQRPQDARLSDGPWLIRARNQLAALDEMPRAVLSALDGTVSRRRQEVQPTDRTYRASEVTPAVLQEVMTRMNRKPGR